MGSPAIDVTGLGKQFHIVAGRTAKYETLRESIGAFMRRRRQPKGTEHELWALDDLTFQIGQGESVGIIGRNGAGKSTLLKILSRITEPTRGSATIYGRVGSLLEVGTGFHLELTGRENIFLNGAILGMRRAETERALDAIVAFAEISRMLDTPVKHYSTGMYMRLAFAVAAHLEPEIMLVDEVLAVGDVAFQRKCLGKMSSVAHAGRTILFVSHNMQAVRQLCERAIWLRDGRIVADGPSGEVIDAYLKDVPDDGGADGLRTAIADLPPDPLFKLHSVAIRQDGQPVSEVLSGRPLEVRIEYDVIEKTPGLHLTIDVCDGDGTLIFQSIHNGDADVPVVERGHYISIATIPADFLAPTVYEVRVSVGIANVRSVVKNLTTRVQVQASGRVNRAYPGYTTPGKIAPLIPWATETRELP